MKSAEREHYGLAVYCARRFRERGVPMEELIAEAEAALLWAASRFDETRGVRFSTYAIPVVLGALRELCRSACPMHVPRSEQRLLAQAEKSRQQLITSLRREPSLRELSYAIGADAQQLGEMLAAQERMRHMDGDPDWNLASGTERFEDWILSLEVIRALPRPYAQVLWLRLVIGASQAEIACRMGVGQPQISRWEKEGRKRLQEAFQE